MDRKPLHVSWFDRFLISIAPKWGVERVRARAQAQLMARHFEAAQGGRRTDNWRRTATDANLANLPALLALRELSRDLRRNNGWAKRGVQAIVNNTVGWGIMPKPKAKPNHASARAQQAIETWNDWADSTACDYDGRLNFYGLQRLVMETVVESGEALILKQPAAAVDKLPIPMRLQVLEPDYLDTSRNGIVGEGGGPIIEGVEFDKQGHRVAYWLFTSHPGGVRLMTTQFASVRVPAERVIHVYRVDRPGQVRGVPWLASAITGIKDLDDFEDAELMRQKVAACFGAFVTDTEGDAVGEQDDDDPKLEHLEPGHIAYLPPGKSVVFPSMPNVQDGAFSERRLRRIAVAIGVTYEDLTGDLSRVNFSSARIGRLAHYQNVIEWREHMLIPQMCNGTWRWAMQLLGEIEDWPTVPYAQWAAPPMPILEPDKEGLAYQRLVRIGAMTWAQMVRELGYDPDEQLAEIKKYNAAFDEAGAVLDCDPRRLTSAGQVQSQTAAPSDGTDGAGDGATADTAGDGSSGASRGDTVCLELGVVAPGNQFRFALQPQPARIED